MPAEKRCAVRLRSFAVFYRLQSVFRRIGEQLVVGEAEDAVRRQFVGNNDFEHRFARAGTAHYRHAFDVGVCDDVDYLILNACEILLTRYPQL